MNIFKKPSPQDAADHFDRYFHKLQQKGSPRPLQVRVFSSKLGLDYSFPVEAAGRPFHTASIGKVFTAALVYRLAERGRLGVRDRVADHLAPALLDRLFVFQGVDYAPQVTVEQLLAHTSGAADYFEGPATGGQSFSDGIISDPDRHWTPELLLDFTRSRQSSVGAPGQGFNYSDTGYILLGLVIEALTGKSFAQNLADEIFLPLEMRDSYLMFYDQPHNTPRPEIEKIWFNGTEISRFESLSCDWAGGGVITTTADLLKFSRALRGGLVVSPANLAAMDSCANKFRPGIYYGRGMMELRFKEFFFLLGHLPRVKGHIGILATHMFYDPTQDAHIVMNFGDSARMEESFRALIEIENTLYRQK